MKAFIPYSFWDLPDMLKAMGIQMAATFEEADIIVFGGGADIDPSLYGEEAHPYTHTSPSREKIEIEAFRKAQAMGKFCLGICRGGQLLNALSGGSMYQHVEGHSAGHHEMTDVRTGQTLWTSSIHHQMMRPSKDAIIVAVCKARGSVEWMHEGEVRRVSFKDRLAIDDPEVVFYPTTRSLCVQGHPEIMTKEMSPFRDYVAGLIKEFF